MTDRERLVELSRIVVVVDIHCVEMVRANEMASAVLDEELAKSLEAWPSPQEMEREMGLKEKPLPAEESQEWENEGGQ